MKGQGKQIKGVSNTTITTTTATDTTTNRKGDHAGAQ